MHSDMYRDKRATGCFWRIHIQQSFLFLPVAFLPHLQQIINPVCESGSEIRWTVITVYAEVEFAESWAVWKNVLVPYTSRLIDGIVLTMFDAIDDKVGAAVSMAYTTGQPIAFVGVGQTYMDLRKMNTKALVRTLLC